jgi:hypothetical protein
VETLNGIHESFSQHLDILDAINPKLWDGADMNKVHATEHAQIAAYALPGRSR